MSDRATPRPDPQLWAIALAGSTVIRCLGHTWRIRTIDEHFVDEARRHHPHVIYVFWHGRLLPLSFTHRNRRVQVLASEHRDGEMLGRTIRRLGFGHVRGSSTRGGTRAILELAEKLELGFDLGITVDGPRGPRYQVKPGPAQIASMSGAAILPITTSSRRHKTFSSWDAFELPYPFTRVDVRYGEPVYVPRGAEPDVIEAKRREVETTLRRITEAGDADVVGR